MTDDILQAIKAQGPNSLGYIAIHRERDVHLCRQELPRFHMGGSIIVIAGPLHESGFTERRSGIVSISGPTVSRAPILIPIPYSQRRMSLQAKLQQASLEFQNLQAELSKVVDARQKLEAQLSENELVKKVSQLSIFEVCLIITSS